MPLPPAATISTIQYMDLNEVLVEHPKSTFFMYADSNAMVDAFIPPGALLVIDRARPARNGDVVVAACNGEFTVRYLQQQEHACWLYPANKHYREIKITPGLNIVIWGVVVQVVINPKYVARV